MSNHDEVRGVHVYLEISHVCGNIDARRREFDAIFGPLLGEHSVFDPGISGANIEFVIEDHSVIAEVIRRVEALDGDDWVGIYRSDSADVEGTLIYVRVRDDSPMSLTDEHKRAVAEILRGEDTTEVKLDRLEKLMDQYREQRRSLLIPVPKTADESGASRK
jgi:hypothetical protein